MAGFDLFGLKKDASPEAPATGGASLPPKAWKGLAAADGLVLLACLALLAVRVRGHLAAPPLPPPKPAPARKAEPPKTEPVAEAKKAEPKAEAKKPDPKPEPKKPEPKKPEAKKPEPKPEPKPEAKAPVKEAEKKPPLGSPAVHAAPTPKRDPSPVGASPAGTPAAPPAPSFAPKKSATRPVPFSYEDAGAKEVYLVGPFLVRSGGRKTMFKDSRGVWQTTVYLNIGQAYKYRFEVVGEAGKKLTPARSVEVLEAD